MKKIYKIQKQNLLITVIANEFYGIASGKKYISNFQIREGVKGVANTEWIGNSSFTNLKHLEGKQWSEIKTTIIKEFMKPADIARANNVREKVFK